MSNEEGADIPSLTQYQRQSLLSYSLQTGGELAAAWRPPPASPPLSLASSRGPCVVLLSGISRGFVLHGAVSGGAAAVVQRFAGEAAGPSQLASLSLLWLPSEGGDPATLAAVTEQERDLYLAAGLWSESRLILLRLSDLVAAANQKEAGGGEKEGRIPDCIHAPLANKSPFFHETQTS